MSSGDGHFYEFGAFRIDTVERRLLRGNQPVPLTPKAYETLLALVGSAGHALDKDELLRRVWPDSFVEEGSLTRNISALRATLGDAGGPFIETIPRRGYRFVAPVRELHAPPESVVVEEHTLSRTVIEETGTSPHRPSLPMADALIERLDRYRPGNPRATRLTDAGAIVLLLAAATILYFATGRIAAPAVRSLAVLPLKSLQNDADAAHIELGIADGIIAKVSQISGLTVRPTSAIRKYMDANPLQAARELKVDAVLEGTLQREGDRLRVSVNLLPAAGGASLWAQTFDVRFTDVLDVEDEVARHVAAQLRLVSGTARPTRQARDHTRNPEAYEHYLRGLYSYEMRKVSGASRPAIEAAIGRFTKATELDPAYAQAHAQLAICYTELMNFYQPDGSMAAQARRAAGRAYALDPDLPELRVFRAWMFWSWYGRYQVEEAIRELRGAAAQNFSAAHSLLGNLYSHAGLVPQAIRELRRALEIDPTNALHLDRLAAAHVWAGQYDEARAVYGRVLAIEPKERTGLIFSALPFLYARQFHEARGILRESRDLAPQNPIAPSYLALLDALEGDSQKAETAIPPLAKASELLLHGHHAFYAFAGICALQGKSAEAVRWLRKTAENGMPNYPMFARDPNLDRIRSSAEFVEFMAAFKPRWEAMNREFR